MIGTVAFGIFGLAVLISIALGFSSNRKNIDWKLVASGIALQLFFAILVILVPGGREFFEGLSRVFVRVISFALDGAAFIFGPLADPSNLGFIFAFQVLPTIIFFAALMAVLYHLGIMQKIVQAMAWVMLKIMRISGSENLCRSPPTYFVGQTEAPLVVRPLHRPHDGVRTVHDDGRRHGDHRRGRAGRLHHDAGRRG